MGNVGLGSQGYEGQASALAEAYRYGQGWASTWAPVWQEEGLVGTVAGVASSEGGVREIRQVQENDRDICPPRRDGASWEECLDYGYDHGPVDRLS